MICMQEAVDSSCFVWSFKLSDFDSIRDIFLYFQKKKKKKREDMHEGGKLFVGGISWETNEENLKEYFGGFGEVMEAVIMKDRATGRARGFGFVVFSDPAVAGRVVNERHTIDGKLVEAKKAIPKDDQSILMSRAIQSSVGANCAKKIFVGGLASTVTESDFKRYFDQFGTITDVVVMYDHATQRPRGFGFITYDSEEAVDKALITTFHELNGKMVEVKRAVPRELSPPPSGSRAFFAGQNYGSATALGCYGLRMDGRFSPVRTGFPRFGSGFEMRMNFDPGFSPYYIRGSNRFGCHPVAYDGNGRNTSFFSSATRNLWGNVPGGINYNTNPPNPYAGGIGRNIDVGSNNWGNSAVTGNNVFDNSNLNFEYGGYGRSGWAAVAPASSSNGGGNVNGGFSDLYGSNSVYGDIANWQSPLSERDGSAAATFGYGLGAAAANADLTAKASPAYACGYSLNKRQPSRGIITA